MSSLNVRQGLFGLLGLHDNLQEHIIVTLAFFNTCLSCIIIPSIKLSSYYYFHYTTVLLKHYSSPAILLLLYSCPESLIPSRNTVPSIKLSYYYYFHYTTVLFKHYAFPVTLFILYYYPSETIIHACITISLVFLLPYLPVSLVSSLIPLFLHHFPFPITPSSPSHLILNSSLHRHLLSTLVFILLSLPPFFHLPVKLSHPLIFTLLLLYHPLSLYISYLADHSILPHTVLHYITLPLFSLASLPFTLHHFIGNITSLNTLTHPYCPFVNGSNTSTSPP